ncbi:class F sortase [Actinokineospora sp. UTMC 2448]|uniref:class F sortase n=1 Tax=Actinokineospora sp. UTMC 2448 TaxID=2268449 RepID=UPI00216453DD|nr:class F sortase [Actinokineospora sp. UTMC 2448]UVS77011.1 Sortase family protein [Actinokineospora sp. UTMC 2448]
MVGRPLVAGAAGIAALALVAALVGGEVTTPGAAVAAPAPPAPAAGVIGAALPVPPPDRSTSAAPTTTPSPPAAPPTAQPKPQPRAQSPGTVRLRGGGEARLVRAELGPDATLPVPENLREATWWGADLAAAEGATVLAGHVNWQGRTGPFAELWDARAGDPVSVVAPDGRVWEYRVSEVVTLPKDDLPARAEELFGQTGPHRLVLVTCGGRWVGGADGYESNRIVVAVPA